MIRRLALLFVGCSVFWGGLAYPAFRLGATTALAQSAIAAALCLLPSSLTLVWSHRALEDRAPNQVAVVLGGTGLRMGAVLASALVLSQLSPEFRQAGFWAWVLVFYLFTLTLEMVLLMAGRPNFHKRGLSTSSDS